MTIEKQQVPCPVCGSQRFRVKYAAKRNVNDAVSLYGATLGVRGTQTLVTCLDCGVIYENPRYPEEIILQGYGAYQEEAHDSQHANRQASFLRGLQAVREYIPPPGASVLDVGTAGGAFLDAAARYGYQACGLESSAYMTEQARRRGLNATAGTLEEALFTPASFDMVCLWGVLEHIARPRDLLKAIRPFLKPQGILLVNYPDIGTPMAKLVGVHLWWIRSVHLVHFDRKSIRKICELSGFDAFHFQPYWKTLEFGYLQEMAMRLGVPFSGFMKLITPDAIKRLPVPYYASQTTALARLKG